MTCCWSVPAPRSPWTAVVEEGESEVDESMVTGEGLPVHTRECSGVIGASINTTGSLPARATKVGSDTAPAQIVALVQASSSR
jgi:Cu2+-exporting ATPase